MKNIHPLLKLLLLLVALSNFAHAFYDPGQGRWVSRDPLGDEVFFQGYVREEIIDLYDADAEERIQDLAAETHGNLYAFVRNDGLNKIDLLGNYSCDTSGEGYREVGPIEADYSRYFDLASLLAHKKDPSKPPAQVAWSNPCNSDDISDFEVTARPSPGSGGESLVGIKGPLNMNIETRYALLHSGSDAESASKAKFCCKCNTNKF
jgi:hypothetical protein